MARRKYIKRVRNGSQVARKTVRISENTFQQAYLRASMSNRSLNSMILEWMRKGSESTEVEIYEKKMPKSVVSLLHVPWKRKVIVYVPKDIVELNFYKLNLKKLAMRRAGLKTIVKGKTMCESFIYSYWITAGSAL